jgi:alpha-beta hydrolase superfamily lysophospholipase
MLRLAPRVPMPTHIDVGLLSREPGLGEAYARDPLVSHAASAGWLRAIGEAQRDVRARAAQLRVPTLMMASGGDRLVDPEATRQFAREAPPDVVEFVCWDGFYHEMLNDIGREQVLAKIVAWLPRTPSG